MPANQSASLQLPSGPATLSPRCWAFSPPGGLASGELCAASEDWCTSCVCGKEWIPRLRWVG